MTDEQALLAAIFDHPDEDTPRLAYADWLDEHAGALPGRDPQEVRDRAAFIRLQIEAERLPPGAKRAAVEGRTRDLEWPRHKEWRAAFEAAYALPIPPIARFRRGFVDRLELYLHGVARFPAVAAVCPLRELVLDGRHAPAVQPDFGPMAACPALARVRRIDFEYLVPEFARTLVPSPYLTGLRVLRMRWGSPEEAVEAASRSPVAAGLRKLAVWGRGEGGVPAGRGLGTLLTTGWPALEAVRIDHLGVKDEEARRLAAGFAARGRKALHVGGDGLTAAGARAAAEAVLAGGLDSLSLANRADQREAPRDLPTGARELRLAGFRGEGDDLASWLVGAVPPGRFGRLGLVGGRMSRGGLRVLLTWPGLPHLRELDLSDNWVGDAGARDLASAPHLEGLEALYVAHNDITKTGKDALKARFGRRVRVS